MFETCIKKQKDIKELFKFCRSKDEIYQKIIEIGRSSPSLASEHKTSANEVPGCQSLMYMRSYQEGDKLFFEAESEALISSGLAALLINVYSGEEPIAILKCPPDFLEEIGISSSLSPNRANGLYNIHLRMKQDALQTFIKPQ